MRLRRFKESDHPRHPAGTDRGGEFREKADAPDWVSRLVGQIDARHGSNFQWRDVLEHRDEIVGRYEVLAPPPVGGWRTVLDVEGDPSEDISIRHGAGPNDYAVYDGWVRLRPVQDRSDTELEVEQLLERYQPVTVQDAVQVNGQPVVRHSGYGTVMYTTAGSDQAAEGMFLWLDDNLREQLATALREGRHPNTIPNDQEVTTGGTIRFADMHRKMMRAVDEGRLTRDSLLWRGILLDPDQVDELFPVGAEVMDQSFMATSTDSIEVARLLEHRLRLEETGRLKSYTLRILAPAGTKVAPGAVGLAELVLRPRVRTRVVDRTGSVITLEVIPSAT